MSEWFVGEHRHSLDEKARLILPARFRQRVKDGCVVTIGQDRCLFVYSREEWERVVERFKHVKLTSLKVRDFTRLIFSSASDEGPDRQGRILIPEQLRRYANLDREVAVIGAGNRIEIWDRARWARHREGAEETYAAMEEPIEELPF